MKRILFISAALEMSDTSAAIRNRKLLVVLSKKFEIDSIEFCAASADFSTKISTINNIIQEMPFTYNKIKSADKKNKNQCKIKATIKKYSRCIIPDNYALNYKFMASSLEKIILQSNYDMVIISSDPKGVHFLWFSKTLKKLKKNGAMTFQYWGDPWFGDIATYNNFLTKLLERKIYGKSDYIIYNSKATFEEKKQSITKNDRFLFLERGLNSDVNKLPDFYSVKLPQKLKISYAGDYRYEYRNLNNVCEALKNTNHTLSIVGSGELKTKYYSQNNIFIKNRVSYQEANNLIDESDVVLIVLNSFGNQIPGKLYDLADSKKPIIMIYDNEKILKYIPFKDRFIFSKNDTSEIKNTIDSLAGNVIDISYKEIKENSFNKKSLAIFNKGKA